MNSDADLWSDLIISIFSVSNCTLEKAYGRLPDLQREGLCSIENLAKWNVEEIADRLARTTMSRGPFMDALFARRLSCVGLAVSKVGIEAAQRVLGTGNSEEISRLLLPIEGIGPKVLANFFMLRGN